MPTATGSITDQRDAYHTTGVSTLRFDIPRETELPRPDECVRRPASGYNLPMRVEAAFVVIILIVALGAVVLAQNATNLMPPSGPRSVTVPLTLDQDRVVIDVDLPLPNGSIERVRGRVDNGNPNLYTSARVANLLGLSVTCDGPICRGTPNSQSAALEIAIDGMKISLSAIKEAKVPANDASALAPGMTAEINIPSTVLRNYDVLIDFPERKFTIGQPGTLKFYGVTSKMLVNPSDGLIQIPSKIENKNYNLGLDLGSSINSLPAELFDRLSNAHPDWPHMTGAVGPFNTGERNDEPAWRLMRVDRIQYGPLFLTDIATANLPMGELLLGGGRPDNSVAGQLSSEALLNYRVGLDYTHSTAYFDIGRTVKFPDFDVVGLILRPEGDTGFTIIGVADCGGKPSVPDVQVGDHLVAVDDNPIADLTLGQVWSLLEGSPGQERKLTVARAGRQFAVVAKVQHFLDVAPRNSEAKGKSKKN